MDGSPSIPDRPITQQRPAWYSRDRDPDSKGQFVNGLLIAWRRESYTHIDAEIRNTSILRGQEPRTHGSGLPNLTACRQVPSPCDPECSQHIEQREVYKRPMEPHALSARRVATRSIHSGPANGHT